ncbi:MAG TPA: hypothetical protein VM681_02075 [Candidatus Thermoplasmatota archaeon]|nr:hypothetical protein [Candidatus Thermoplasmatota archaeon]
MLSTKRALAVLFVMVLVVPYVPLGETKPGMGVHFGLGHVPAGCNTSFTGSTPRFTDGCYHMRTNLNHLDTPILDVLLVPPATTYPERDLRTMRQAIEMWRDGIHYLAPQMGLDWLLAVEFNIFVDDETLTTDPLWDPEIVVVVTNPAGGAGIGIDPLGFRAPCRGANPLASLEAWQALPGFDSHHQGHGGTYVEECPGGGTTCYAVNGAIDPVPGTIDFFGLYDLVAHEVGHCLSVGHVGDALDHKANAVPSADIMAYANQAFNKCVSTLDVEAFALRMSRFLLPRPLVANHEDGPGGQFQIQHPADHYYASPTGLAKDCPQPAERLQQIGGTGSFTPSGGVQRAPPRIAIASHVDGATVAAGPIELAGTVRYNVSGPGAPDGSVLGNGASGHPHGRVATTVSLQDSGIPPNTFFPQHSSFGVRTNTGRTFTLPVAEPSEVTIDLRWFGNLGALDDLDLYVTGAAAKSSTQGFTTSERVVLPNVPAGTLAIRVDPYQVNDPLFGVRYELVADVLPKALSPTDQDGDGVANASDACSNTAFGVPVTSDGCPIAGYDERVVVLANGVVKAVQAVNGNGGAAFNRTVDLTGLSGSVEVMAVWYDGNWIVASRTITLVVA